MSEWGTVAIRLASWAIDLRRGKSISGSWLDLEDAAAVIRYQEKLIKNLQRQIATLEIAPRKRLLVPASQRFQRMENS